VSFLCVGKQCYIMIYNYVYDIDIRNLTFKKVNHGKQFV